MQGRLEHDSHERPCVLGARQVREPEDPLACPAFGRRQEREVEQPRLLVREHERAVGLGGRGLWIGRPEGCDPGAGAGRPDESMTTPLIHGPAFSIGATAGSPASAGRAAGSARHLAARPAPAPTRAAVTAHTATSPTAIGCNPPMSIIVRTPRARAVTVAEATAAVARPAAKPAAARTVVSSHASETASGAEPGRSK